MFKLSKTDAFIKKANNLHNFKYNYSLVTYIKYNLKVNIICEKHGIFLQKPEHHLRKQGCPNCSKFNTTRIDKYNKEFIDRANMIHNYKYFYNNNVFIKSQEKLIITCQKHGNFKQLATSHLAGHGCRKCSTDINSKRQKITINQFIERSNIIHNNKYDYSKSVYININNKIIINCPFHGEWLSIPKNHLRGKGCKQCSDNFNMYRKSHWIKKADNKQGTFYIIRCWNENEEFFKCGITFVNIKSRYSGKKAMPYNWEIIKEVKSYDLEYIWNLEKRFIKNKLKVHYSPLIVFGGSKYECFKN